MFGTQDLTLFIVSGLLLNIAPGPDSLLIMARSASQGFRAGSAAALGVGSGTLVHVLAAALGLSALMAASSWAFGLVKLLGAAYLVYIGLSLLLRRAAAEGPREAAATLPPKQSLRSIYLQGLLTNVLNPKVALFFLAFVPQFIAADAPSKPLAFVFLGLVFNLNGMLWCHFLAWSTAQASRRITASPRVVSWLNRAIGAVFLGFGLRLALAQR
ncbi:lysine transporter LysE [Paucibacter aquatile]|uniref:Lysine transporter LysE n=1 Tax=Kinneretia aquatilis TaxID=2070761 RepID=A0A2N8KZH2_9BURK|nr:LysE family translocator [Paucibacter aquatile]PND38844.1 lysine transporter LysE [Paucibacter aquatile]